MRILVVEDEKNMNRIISETLEDEKYSVDRCYDGQEALDYALAAEYDVIVLDIIWFCHDLRFVFRGTEDMVEDYHDYRFHIKGFFIGEVLALAVCALTGLIVRFAL